MNLHRSRVFMDEQDMYCWIQWWRYWWTLKSKTTWKWYLQGVYLYSVFFRLWPKRHNFGPHLTTLGGFGSDIGPFGSYEFQVSRRKFKFVLFTFLCSVNSAKTETSKKWNSDSLNFDNFVSQNESQTQMWQNFYNWPGKLDC